MVNHLFNLWVVNSLVNGVIPTGIWRVGGDDASDVIRLITFSDEATNKTIRLREVVTCSDEAIDMRPAADCPGIVDECLDDPRGVRVDLQCDLDGRISFSGL